jgi:hypothetical protein
MTTAIMTLPSLVNRASEIHTSKDSVSELRGLLDSMYLSRTQRRELKTKLKIREMEGQVFHFQDLFDHEDAWRKNGTDIISMSVDALLPTIGFACVKDTVTRYFMRGCSFRTGRDLFPTGRQHLDGTPWGTLEAPTPFIPKHHMPRWGTRWEHFIMFDVEKWTARNVVDDPFILRQVGDFHFKVVSHWDLSGNEKKLMKFAVSG